MTATLVGRESELEQIRSVLGNAEGVAAVFVLADPGVGKSRLIAEAADAIDLPIRRIVGYETEQQVPLAAAAEFLRALTEAGEQGALLDELAFGRRSASEPLRVFEAAHRALVSNGPTLLLVDDAQWADDLSLALVHYLLRAAGAGTSTLLFVGAGRRTQRAIAFSEGVERLVTTRSLVMELAPLERAATSALASSLDPSLTPGAIAQIYEQSGGIPFWIETLVRTEEGVDPALLLTRRLRGVAPDAGAVLALLAVVARPLAAMEVADMLGWPGPRVDAAAEDLASRGIVVRAHGLIRVAHDLLREAASSELGERQRRQLHRHVAEWLERGADGDLASLKQALTHRLAAREQPFALAAQIVTSPRRRQLGVEGLSALLELAEAADPRTGDGQALRRGVAALAAELGEHGIALERWRAFSSSAATRQARLDGLIGALKACRALGWDFAEQAHALLTEVYAAATSADERVTIRAQEAQILLWLDHRTDEGTAAATEALEQSRQLGRPDVHLEALNTAWGAAMQQNDGEAILRLGEEMLAVTRGRDDDAYVDALLVHADGLARTGPLRAAEAQVRTALDLARRRVLPVQQANAVLSLVDVLHDRGRLVEAAELVESARGLIQRVDGVRPTRLIAHEIALVRRARSFDEHLSAYLVDIDARPDPHVRVWPRNLAALLLSRVRRTAAQAEVASLYHDARRDALAARCPRCLNVLQTTGAEALARVGLVAQAAAELTAADEALPARDDVHRMHRLHAHALITAAGTADAAARLERVCAEAARLDRTLERLWAEIDLALALREDDSKRSAGLLREAAGVASSIGAGTVVEVADQQLRHLGVRTWRRAHTDLEALTVREREIATLVAQGATNPEIAKTLFLSRKTVERHVSNALAKLGARNRVELSAALTQETEGAHR